MIDEALRVSAGDKFDQIDLRIQQLKIKVHLNAEDPALDRMFETKRQ
jgi:hypothetical protein